MTMSTEPRAYQAHATISNRNQTLREVSLTGLEAPLPMGFHPEVAEIYGITPDTYEEAPATYDYLAGAIAGCLTGVFSGMLEARGVATGDGRLTANATAQTEWRDRVLRVKSVQVHYTLQGNSADQSVIQRAHDKHVSKCSMAQSVAGAIDVTTSYELT